jgi:hypothetical protein
LTKLRDGELDVVFAVDMFNEGVDVPAIDTVMMLRPTESRVLWMQQFGRGLRFAEGKKLHVIDYVGNHRSFLAALQAVMGVGSDPWVLRQKLRAMRAAGGEVELPHGCHVTYDLGAIRLAGELGAGVEEGRGVRALGTRVRRAAGAAADGRRGVSRRVRAERLAQDVAALVCRAFDARRAQRG